MRTLLRAVTLGLLLFCSVLLAEPNEQRILYLSSYHPAFPTFFQEIEGILEVFSSPDYIVDVEYLDSKRFPAPQFQELKRRNLSYKLNSLPKYDGIISADDNALVFINRYKEELFQNTPVVFFGVNNRELALSQNRDPDITGMIESLPIRDTLKLIQHLYPKTGTIYAVVDETPTAQGDRATYYEVGKEFSELELRVLSLEEMSIEELSRRLGELTDRDQLILFSAYRDAEGQSFTYEESLEIIRASIDKPIFHLWNHSIGSGFLGGKLIDKYEHAKAAATILREIISGTIEIENIPVQEKSPNRYEFDYNELIRFNIRLDQLPEGSVIYGKPENPFWQSQVSVIILAVILMIQGITIAYLIVVLIRWRQDRRNLHRNEKRFESIFEYSPISLWEEDFSQVKRYLEEVSAGGVGEIPGYIDDHPELAPLFAEKIIVLDANRTAMEMNHIGDKSKILGRLSKTLKPEEYPELLKEVKAMWTGEVEQRWEIAYPRPEGMGYGEVSLAVAPGAEFDWSQVYVTIQDITARKEASKRLRAALEEKEILVKEIHHRVKNNLAIVTAFLHLSSLKSNNHATRSLFQDCEARVHSMARVHEGLYKSEDLRNIDLPLYLEDNTSYLVDLYQDPRAPIELSVRAQALDLTIDELIPLGLLVTEAVTNAIKHGSVPGRDPKIDIRLVEREGVAELRVADNGGGMAENAFDQSTGSLGLTLMNSLAEQLQGKMEIESDSSGTRIEIRFPYSSRPSASR